MTPEEISKLMQMPFSELVKVCRDPETLAYVISLAVNMGLKLGREQAHNHYNRMFRSQTKLTVEN